MKNTLTTNRWAKRSFLGIPLIGWLVLAVTGAAFAAAVFFFTFGVTGTVSVSGDTIESSEFTLVSASATGPCDITLSGGTGVDIQATGLVPGDSCEFTVGVANSGTDVAAFQGFNTQIPDDGKQYPNFQANWDYWDNTDPENPVLVEVRNCGKQILASQTTNVSLRLSVDDGVTPGVSLDLSASEGFRFVPLALYDIPSCG
jgi:hypothetical protein